MVVVPGDTDAPVLFRRDVNIGCHRPREFSQCFGEGECVKGGLGQFEAKHLMTLALANAGRLGKYGA